MKNRFSLYLLAMLCSFSCSQERTTREYIMDIPMIANKTPEEVVSILGEPDSTYIQKRGSKKVPVHIYTPYKIEVYYPSGKATEVLVNKTGNLQYNENSLSFFNIKPSTPNKEKSLAAYKWSDVEGFKNITFFSDNIQADTVSSFKMFFNTKEE